MVLYKNVLFIRMQFTSNMDGMTSLESLSKDVIRPILEVNCICTNKTFLYKTTPLHRLKNLKIEEWLPLRVRVKAVKCRQN